MYVFIFSHSINLSLFIIPFKEAQEQFILTNASLCMKAWQPKGKIIHSTNIMVYKVEHVIPQFFIITKSCFQSIFSVCHLCTGAIILENPSCYQTINSWEQF